MFGTFFAIFVARKNIKYSKEIMKVKLVCVAIMWLTVVVGCGGLNKQNTDANSETAEGNIYSDATLQKIYDLRCRRNTAELVRFLSNNYPEYRKAAAMAVGSLRDSMATLSVATLLSDDFEDVRKTAAFALGEIGRQSAEYNLLEIYNKEQSDDVKATMLEALGKCASPKSLDFVCNINIEKENVTLLAGQIRSICRFAQRSITSAAAVDKAMELLLNSDVNEKVRATAAEYFAQYNGNLSRFSTGLIDAFAAAKLVSTKTNIITAMGKTGTTECLGFIHGVLGSGYDYRICISAINACANYEYSKNREIMLNLLNNNDVRISQTAAEYIFDNGSVADTTVYLDLSRQNQFWQTRIKLLAATLKYSKDKKAIATSIKSGFEVSNNIYEKVALLHALAGDLGSVGFLTEQTFNADNQMLRTEGLKTLIDMTKQKDFKKNAEKQRKHGGENLIEEFSMIFKRAVQNGNPAMVALAANAIAEDLGYTDYYVNTFFLTQALHNCEIPRDEDTYRILAQAVLKINGQIAPEPPVVTDFYPDWKTICSISPNTKVKLHTDKGDITILLDINHAPLAVANFLKLVESGYYDQSVFNDTMGITIENHGNVNGYEDNRQFLLPLELSQDNFSEGSVAMASSTMGYASSVEWFVTRMPSISLDGNNTLIASIIDGLDIVHKLQTGDKIIKAEII